MQMQNGNQFATSDHPSTTYMGTSCNFYDGIGFWIVANTGTCVPTAILNSHSEFIWQLSSSVQLALRYSRMWVEYY